MDAKLKNNSIINQFSGKLIFKKDSLLFFSVHRADSPFFVSCIWVDSYGGVCSDCQKAAYFIA